MTIEKTASAAQFTGAGGAIFFGLTVNDWGIVFGIIIGALGLLVNAYYKHKKEQRDAAFQRAILSTRASNQIPPGLEKYLGQSDED